MKPVCFACFFVLCLTIRPVWAQDAGTSEVFVPQVAPSTEPISREDAMQLVRERLVPQDQHLLDDYLRTRLPQGGHFGLIHQDGAANLAVMDQDGASNLAVMMQHGSGNTTQLTQHGTGNIYGAWLTGNDNRLNVTQHGDANTYLLEFAGNGLAFEHEAIQVGAGNQAVQLGTGTVPFGIEQRGDGMTLIIRHN